MLVAGFALAPTPTTRHPGRAAASKRVLPPSASRSTARPRSPTAPAQTTLTTQTTRMREGSPAAQRPHPRAQVGNPERPPSPRSSLGAMLAVARRFSIAYMPYQIDRLPGWVRAAITRTCTPAFARYLLGQPPRLTAQLLAHPKAIETYRVVSVNLAAGANRATVSYVSRQDSADTGAFLLTLISQRGRWLVAGLET